MRNQVAAIAQATYKEAVRDRVLWIILVFALGLVIFSRVLGWLSVEDELKMVQDFSFSGMSLLALFLAMLIGAFSIARELERRTASTLLSRDLSRGEFLFGKFVGLIAVCWTCLLGAGLVLLVWLLLWGGSVAGSYVAAWLGILFEALPLTAVALMLGTAANAALAAAGTCVFYLVGHSVEALRDLVADGKNPEFATFYRVVYRVMPNLEDVNFINAIGSSRALVWSDLFLGGVTMVCWSAIFLSVATILFHRKEL